MSMSTNQPELPDDGERCGSCRHGVDVRGMEQIVCLAYLAVRHPMNDGSCVEFERQRSKPVAW